MLFDIPNDKVVNVTLPLITHNYKEIHFDEIPMLYSGSNEMGNHVIGSLICDDTDQDIYRYIHSIVTPKDYTLFIRNKISYRSLIERQKSVFLIDKNYSDDIIRTYYLPVESIPKDYLPHPGFYCPESEMLFGTEFSFSLKGRIADLHEATSNTVSSLSTALNEFLLKIAETIAINSIHIKTIQVAPTASSFGLNFKVKFESQDLYLQAVGQRLRRYFTNAIHYSINILPSEALSLNTSQIESTQYSKIIEQELVDIYSGMSRKYDPTDKDKTLKIFLKIPASLEKITTHIGEGFDIIEVLARDEFKNHESLGIMDQDFSDAIVATNDNLEEIDEAASTDPDFIEYAIYVYHLNKKSRRGNAHVSSINEDGVKSLDSPRFKILGDKDLTGSPFTESINSGIEINVRAKAKRMKGRIQSLTIDYA